MDKKVCSILGTACLLLWYVTYLKLVRYIYFISKYLPKVIVPLTHDGTAGRIFDLVCPGYAKGISHKELLLLKNATVNWNSGFDDVCKEKEVYVAYNNEPWAFEVSHSGDMVKYPVKPFVSYLNVVWEWEIQEAFFETNNIQPKWLNALGTLGTLNYTTGQWSGAVGMIQRDEARAYYSIENN